VLLDGRDTCKYAGYDKRRWHTPNCYLFVGPSWLYCRNYIPKNKDHQTSRTITKTDNTELGSVFHIWQTQIHKFLKIICTKPRREKK
jgi:hypothetical protein